MSGDFNSKFLRTVKGRVSPLFKVENMGVRVKEYGSGNLFSYYILVTVVIVQLLRRSKLALSFKCSTFGN